MSLDDEMVMVAEGIRSGAAKSGCRKTACCIQVHTANHGEMVDYQASRGHGNAGSEWHTEDAE